MKYFGTQTNYLLDKSKPYQRPELRHAGPNDVNREAELEPPSRVACSDLLGLLDIFPQIKAKNLSKPLNLGLAGKL